MADSPIGLAPTRFMYTVFVDLSRIDASAPDCHRPATVCARVLASSVVPLTREEITGESFFGLKRDAGPEILMAAIALPIESRIGAPMQTANVELSPRSKAKPALRTRLSSARK